MKNQPSKLWNGRKGWIRLPNGKALTGFNHEYKRHGTSTLFAALNIASGQIQAGHYRRRRRRDFLQFMNQVLAGHADQQIHVVLDNLSSHKPKDDRWLRAHFHSHPRLLAQSDRDLV
jgi:DDE superfamily endonuclease